MMTSSGDSLERIVPESLEAGEVTGAETLRLHLERYHFAGQYLPDGVVLDLACGVGYGSARLGANRPGRYVIGADLSTTALHHARTNYHRPGVQFVRGDGASWLRPKSADGLASLETLEHVDDPSALFAGLVAALRPQGVLVASVPVTPSVDANPHHKTDFTAAAFLALGRRHGLVVLSQLDQRQTYSPVSVLARRERRTQDLRRGLLAYYLHHPAALRRRLFALAKFGFTNRYLTVAWRKGDE
jgi:SAM-dependent methyltransferase